MMMLGVKHKEQRISNQVLIYLDVSQCISLTGNLAASFSIGGRVCSGRSLSHTGCQIGRLTFPMRCRPFGSGERWCCVWNFDTRHAFRSLCEIGAFWWVEKALVMRLLCDQPGSRPRRWVHAHVPRLPTWRTAPWNGHRGCSRGKTRSGCTVHYLCIRATFQWSAKSLVSLRVL